MTITPEHRALEIMRLIQSLADPPIVGRAKEALRALVAELVDPEVKPLSESHAIWAYTAGDAGIGLVAKAMLGYDLTENRRYALSAPKLEALEAIVELIVTDLLDEETATELVDSILRVDAHVADEAQRAELYDAACTELGAALRRPEGWWDEGKGWWDGSVS